MAVPKRKTSKAKKNSRRASAYRLNKANFVVDKETGEARMPHRVSPSGYYNGRQVVEVEDEE
ncbi:50S ribosomal protein L32 [Helcococcus massiliensis]|uniref:50S ribosomal protein L32 n=1 Tax=Helcococcus massiliensis TaxID=2040290 RepID=UPI000CDF21FA|nr:50S ribosomal protein L32 [Helcococcus massiliensis]